MNDAVVTFHTNPYTCGVAKFNLRLAKELGVPLVGLQDIHDRYKSDLAELIPSHPLVSIKFAELVAHRFCLRPLPRFDLFLHDEPRYTDHVALIKASTRVYAANCVIAAAVREHRQDVIEAFCPSLVEFPRPRAARTILTFGMAHKYVDSGAQKFGLPLSIRTQPLTVYYEKLNTLLLKTRKPFTILLSTGVHEGTPWDYALEESAAEMRRIFGDDRVEVLGFLSDAALHNEICNVKACAAFYTPAFRANNTTAWAILERGVPLITNIDDYSPTAHSVFNIDKMDRWPDCGSVGEHIQDGWLGVSDYGWDCLIPIVTSCEK